MFFESEGPGGTGANAVTTSLAGILSNRLVTKSGDYPAEAAVGKAENSYTQALATHPHAPSAEYAFIPVVNEHRTAGIYRKVSQ